MHVITCEQVSSGHPDKICDQIADAIVTDVLAHDRAARVAAEVMIKGNVVIIAGEITSSYTPDYRELVREVFRRIGVDRLGYDPDIFDVGILIDRQSPDIALGVDRGGAGDQGMMYGYATNETPELLPIPFVLATDFLRILQHHPSHMFRADAKAQVSFDYDSGRITTFLCSVQHSPDVEPGDFRHVIEAMMVLAAARLGLNTDFEKLVNPTGRFVLGGPFADCGVTGRKLACDTYGSVGHIGGGAMCVDGDTEFLTPTGWKKIRDFDGGFVGQWEDGKLSFVEPYAFIKNPAGSLLHIRSDEVLDMVLTPNHDVVLETSKGGIIKKPVNLLFDEHGVRNGNFGFIPTSFRYGDDGRGLPLSDDSIRLQVAFCADGTILQHKERWTGRVRVKRQAKKERMRLLLERTGTKYKESEDGEFSIFYFCPPFVCKQLSDCFQGANTKQLCVIANEVQLWDGEKRTFRTTIKEDADFVQFAFMAAYGTNATILEDDRLGETYIRDGKEYIRKSVMYRVYSTKWTKHQIKHGQIKSGTCSVEAFEPDDGFMYCFSVPSGMLVLRRNNRVFVTGNCGKDPSKVDRSGAYIARKIARDIVMAGYADKAEVQIAYAIGVAEPVSIHVDCFGTEKQSQEFLEGYIRDNYDLTPRGIINTLHLLDVDYNRVSAYGHFGKSGLPWEV